MKNFNRAEKFNNKDYETENKKELKRMFTKMEELIASNGGPEEFFSRGQYESTDRFEELFDQIADLAFKILKNREFSEVLDIGRNVLEVSGVKAAGKVSIENPSAVIALTEAVNWAAKTISYHFYSLKPMMIAAASQIHGVNFGYGEDGAYYLGSPTIGTASFHDPGDEVGYLMTHCLKKPIPEWEHRWSGVSRQEEAFDILEDLSSGRGMVEAYADATSPEEIKIARDKYMKNSFNQRLATLGEILEQKRKI